ncbi:TIGR03545 family protein, partial [bacterium]|nr:TIGR03545 family protein [bacterium]
MRPKGVIAALVVLVLFVTFAYLISDDLIERGIERTGQNVIGTKVEIDNLNFSLADLAISLDRLQVANPNDGWKNLFETGEMAFNMEWAPLARRKVIINNITVADIRVGGQRETDGSLPRSHGKAEAGWIEEAKSSLGEKLASVPILNLAILSRKVNVDSLLATFDIQSVDRIDHLKIQADSTHKNWKARLAEFAPKDELEKIGRDIQAIKPQEIKGIKDLVSTLDRTKTVYASLNNLKKDVGKKKTEAAEDLKQLAGRAASVDQWIAEDFESIKTKVNLGEFTPQNVGTMIFGRSLVQRLLDMLPYIDLIREYMPVAEKVVKANKVESPPRFVGQDIPFALEAEKPDFLIEKIFISGASDHVDTSRTLSLSGEANGITSNPRAYGNPLSFALAAALPGPNSYQVAGEVDHTGDLPAERFSVKGAGFPIGNVKLWPQRYLPSEINVKSADLAATMNLKGKEIGFGLEFFGRPVAFMFPEGRANGDAISKITSEVFGSIDQIKLTARIHGQAGDLGLSIESNIDNILASRIKGVIGKSANLTRAEIQNKLHTKIQPHKQKTLALVHRYQNDIDTEINKIEN